MNNFVGKGTDECAYFREHPLGWLEYLDKKLGGNSPIEIIRNGISKRLKNLTRSFRYSRQRMPIISFRQTEVITRLRIGLHGSSRVDYALLNHAATETGEIQYVLAEYILLTGFDN
jgi:hypothetical protein